MRLTLAVNNTQGSIECRHHVPFQRSQHREQSRRRAETKKIYYELWSSEYANQLEIFQDFVDQDLDVIGVIDDLETKRTTMIVETGGSNVMSPNVVMSPISAITQRISMPILENDLFQQNFRDEQVIGFKFSNWNFFQSQFQRMECLNQNNVFYLCYQILFRL